MVPIFCGNNFSAALLFIHADPEDQVLALGMSVRGLCTVIFTDISKLLFQKAYQLPFLPAACECALYRKSVMNFTGGIIQV